MNMHTPSTRTPAAASLLFAAALAFGASYGVQMLVIDRATGLGADGAGYWYVYSLIAAAGAIGLYWACKLLRTRISALLLRRTHKARLTGSEAARQYLLRREIRERNRPIKGHGGPCSPNWQTRFGA